MGVQSRSTAKILTRTGVSKSVGKFRRNRIDDVPAICDLNENAMLQRNPETGFMLFPLDTLNTMYFISLGINKLVTYSDKGKVKGFALYNTLPEYLVESSNEIQTLFDMRPELKQQRGVFLEKILVAPEYRGKHIASQLLEQIISDNPSLDFIASSVITKPVTNHASLKFHHNNGFEDVGLVDHNADMEIEEDDGQIIRISPISEFPELESMLLLKNLR